MIRGLIGQGEIRAVWAVLVALLRDAKVVSEKDFVCVPIAMSKVRIL